MLEKMADFFENRLDTTNWFFRYVTYKNQNPDFYPYVPKST